MALTTKAVVLDEEQYQKLPKGDRSRLIRDLISAHLSYQTGEIGAIDEELLSRKKRTLENKKIQIDAELESICSTIEKIKENREKEAQKTLENEKKRLEMAKKCLNCGKLLELDIKYYKFTKGQVCHTCYMTFGTTKLKEWV